MQVTIESSQDIQRTIKVEVPVDRINKEYEKRLIEMAPKVKLAGFRPGKVPIRVVKQQFGKDMYGQVIGDTMRETLYEALAQEKLNPAGIPKIEPIQVDQGQPLQYKASFEIFPEIKPKDLKKTAVEKITSEVTKQDVDTALEAVRKQHATWEPVERAAEMGDRLTIGFVGRVDGEEFEGGRSENYDIELGSKALIPGFEEGLVGCRAGDEKVLDLKFPDDYFSENLKGKATAFTVKVHKVAESKLPELNDEFAEKFNIKDDNKVQKLQEEIENSMKRNLKTHVERLFQQRVLDLFLDKNSFSVPQALVEEEAKHLQEQTQKNFAAQSGMDPKQLGQFFPLDTFMENAKKRVALGLLCRSYAEANDIKVDDDRVKQHIEKIAEDYDDKDAVIAAYYKQKDHLAYVQAIVLNEQIIEKLVENMKVTEKALSYEEAMAIKS